MVVEANKVNNCGIYCVDCPNKNLTTEEIPMYANNSPGILVRCENADFCRFLIERIHTTDSMKGIFGGDRRE